MHETLSFESYVRFATVSHNGSGDLGEKARRRTAENGMERLTEKRRGTVDTTENTGSFNSIALKHCLDYFLHYRSIVR